MNAFKTYLKTTSYSFIVFVISIVITAMILKFFLHEKVHAPQILSDIQVGMVLVIYSSPIIFILLFLYSIFYFLTIRLGLNLLLAFFIPFFLHIVISYYFFDNGNQITIYYLTYILLGYFPFCLMFIKLMSNKKL